MRPFQNLFDEYKLVKHIQPIEKRGVEIGHPDSELEIKSIADKLYQFYDEQCITPELYAEFCKRYSEDVYVATLCSNDRRITLAVLDFFSYPRKNILQCSKRTISK